MIGMVRVLPRDDLECVITGVKPADNQNHAEAMLRQTNQLEIKRGHQTITMHPKRTFPYLTQSSVYWAWIPSGCLSTPADQNLVGEILAAPAAVC